MRIFGFEITRAKAAPPVPVYENRGGWWPVIRESYTGAWQHNVTLDRDTIVSNPTVWACTTRIASDGAKMRCYLEKIDKSGIWSEHNSAAYSPVLRKPNRFQTMVQFNENWFLSKLFRGNTYVLKQRDQRNIVTALYVLDPNRVKPLVADDGSVYYQLSADNMVGQAEDEIVPASEIIHDRYNCLFHPLIGTSPIYAAGVAAMQGLNIQKNSTWFFGNRSQPGGILTAPGSISDETAARIKERWDTKFSGENAGKIAVLGDDLKYQHLSMTAEESQLIEQLKWTAEAICTAYHMPQFMVGVGPLPGHENVDAMLNMYYSLCLQDYVQSYEACLTEGLGLPTSMRVQLDEDTLLRMNKSALYRTIGEGIRGGFLAPNEGRKMDNRKPLPGGDTVFLQEQDHSLEWLARRDAQPIEEPEPAPVNDNTAEQANAALVEIYKGLRG